jgi:hypothetical protein
MEFWQEGGVRLKRRRNVTIEQILFLLRIVSKLFVLNSIFFITTRD